MRAFARTSRPTNMKVIITKYALTSGVLVLEARESHTPTMVSANGQCFHKPDWHTTRAEAVFRVGKMAAARRRLLTKSLKQLDDRVATAIAIVQEARV